MLWINKHRINTESKMKTYIYQDKPLHINRCRRKEDLIKHDPNSKEKSSDRRRKVRSGIIFKDYDRRQKNDKNYSGPERRKGVERRSGKDRRQKTRTSK